MDVYDADGDRKLSVEELGELRRHLRGNWRMYDARVPPTSYAKWTPAMSERPDVYISDLS